MKYIKIILLMLVSNNIQAQTELLLIPGNDGFQRVVLSNSKNGQIPDTISGFAYTVEFLDYKIYSKIEVSYVVKSRLGYQYIRRKKLNSKWITQLQSGFIAGNPDRLSFVPIGTNYPIDSTFKIIGDDKVQYRYKRYNPNNEEKYLGIYELIVDGKENEQRNRAWIKRCEDYIEKNKKH